MMETAKAYNDDPERDANIAMEALLQAIQRQVSGEGNAYREHARSVAVKGEGYDACTGLAAAFEFDIHDCAMTEVNR